MNHDVKVEIFGADYTIKSEHKPEYTEKLAKYVDKKMNEVSIGTKTVSTTKIAVLASINIADDMFKFKFKEKVSDQIKLDIEKRVKNLIKIVDEVIV